MNHSRDLSRIGSIDYLLMTIGTCLAAYSGGMAIQKPELGIFCVQWIIVGAVFSNLVRRFAVGKKIVKWDGLFYGLSVFAAFMFGRNLQVLMPDGGFPRELVAAGWLCWMLILGSYFTWQDSTLLFQAVPSIALFGLVGCFDTFSSVRFFFFGFLICLAGLFSRAHFRQMLRQAADSGYFTRGLAPGAPIPEVETTPGLAQEMRQGPWRWVAGPEWALGSAFVVVLVSLLGAPVIKSSVSGVSGFVRMPSVPGTRQRSQINQSGVSESATYVRIGRGPNRLTTDPVFEMEADQVRYLRIGTFDVYTGNGWTKAPPPPPAPGETNSVNDLSYLAISPSNRSEFSYKIKKIQTVSVVPAAGVIVKWSYLRPSQMRGDGALEVPGGMTEQAMTVEAVEPAELVGKDAVRDLPTVFRGMVSQSAIPGRVRDFALEAAGTGGTDWERAERIRKAIASRIVYNINVEETPAGLDPVEHALFGSKQGYCDVFANAMTLMARSEGIPARYVVGYLPDGDSRDGAGRFIVMGKDAHAWAELYFEGLGWVPFDATEGAESIDGAERGAATDDRPWYQRESFRTVLDLLIVIVAVGGIGFAVRASAIQRAKRTVRGDLEKEYATFARLLERYTGRRRTPDITADEWIDAAEPRLGIAKAPARDLNARFVAALYAPRETSEEDLAKMRSDLRNLRRLLRERSKSTRDE